MTEAIGPMLLAVALLAGLGIAAWFFTGDKGGGM